MNVERRYSGMRNDPYLTPEGMKQAERVAAELSKLPIEAIWSSDLARTRQVALRIYLACDRQLSFDRRLRETDVGDMSGLHKDDAVAQFPDEHHRTSTPAYDFRDIGGESFSQVVQRQLDCFREILEHHGTDSADDAPFVVVVGHGTSLRTMLRFLGIKPAKLHQQGEYQIVPFSE